MNFMSPAVRVSLSLVLLTVSILLAADLLGIMPDNSKAQMDGRKKFIETLAVQTSKAAEKSDLETISVLISNAVNRNEDIHSAALRTANKKIQASAGDHNKYWQLVDGEKSTPRQIRVPIYDGKERWGTVEVSFSPLNSRMHFGYAINSLAETIAFVAFLGFLVYLMFMKKTLRHLDPSAVIPERVRAALDALAEGLVLMDEKEQIVLANISFSKKAGLSPEQLLGKKVSELNWAVSRKEDNDIEFPWHVTLRTAEINTGQSLKFNTADGVRTFSINSTPILDAKGKQKGALATFDDITVLEEKNKLLEQAKNNLEKSQSEIEKKNKELVILATTDPMTGCLNRRAFFDAFNSAFTNANENGEELCCIMADIDHFKSVNDTFGHGAGDVVIQKMAQALEESVREEDIVSRFGGEEFCIILPGISLTDAVSIAERVRITVTKKIKEEVDVIPGRIVTTSLGVTSSYLGAEDESTLVEQADSALYISKETGRNKVSRYDEMEATTDLEPA